MHRTIEKLSGHTIICGWGQVGHAIGDALEAKGVDIVVVTRDDETAPSHDVLSVIGDATNDELLRRAGVERAAVVIVAMDSDPDNVYVTLSAREMNPALRIVARASSKTVESKLRHAGADDVVNPHRIGGERMAELSIDH